MRIGYVYTNAPNWPKSLWVRNAMERLGHDVRQVTTLDELRSADADSDLILFQHKNAGLHPNAVIELSATRRAFWAQWWFDLIFSVPGKPLTEQQQFYGNGRFMKAMDAVFVKEADELHQFEAEGIHAVYLDQGAPIELPRIEDRPKRWDFILWGQSSNQYRQRSQDVSALVKAGYRVLWIGCDSPPIGVDHYPWTHPTMLHTFCSQARAVLCVDARSDVAGYTSDRFWMAAAMGCTIFKRFSPGFVAGPFITFSAVDELLSQAAHLFSRPVVSGADTQCTPISPVGGEEVNPCSSPSPPTGFSPHEVRQWAMTNHSIDQRCRKLLESVVTATAAA